MTELKQLTTQELLDARVHFGHSTQKRHPHFSPYIFMSKNGIHIIDLKQTLACLTRAIKPMKALIESGKKILFVGTKKIAKGFIKEQAEKLAQPYVSEKWLGGTLTNFITIRKLLKKLSNMDVVKESAGYKHLTKKEQLSFAHKQAKLEKNLKGLSTINRLPAAIFVVDIKKEQTCVKEATKLGIPVFAIVDSNSSPEMVEYPIPANDDASSSISVILHYIANELASSMDKVQKTKPETK
ncbi:MAG: 30S ribosomal protein S2 [Bacteroidota bacterium]